MFVFGVNIPQQLHDIYFLNSNNTLINILVHRWHHMTSWGRLNVQEKSSYNMPWRHRRGIEAWLYTFFNLGARLVWVVNAAALPLYSPPPPRTRNAVTIKNVQEAKWDSETVWTDK